MSISLRNKLFFSNVFCVIFSNIPRLLQLNFIGSFMGNKLSIYPLLVSFIFFIKTYRGKSIVGFPSNVKRLISGYILTYIGIILISFIHGLIIYPYYDVILSGPVNQIEKLPYVYNFLQQRGIIIPEVFLLKLWMFARLIKGFILESFWFFSIPLLVFTWFKDDVTTGIKVLQKAMISAAILVCSYGLLDIFYLSGSMLSKLILVYLNPIVHEIRLNNTWWPPLLWNNQLRSLFAEPSYYGIFCAFSVPWIWLAMLQTRKKIQKLLFVLLLFTLIFELFLTKSRTANALFGGELVLLATITLFYRKKEFIKNTLLIVAISLTAFCTSISLMKYMPGSPEAKYSMGYQKNNGQEAILYLEDNLGSITSSTKRSNKSRLSILKASLALGKDHFFLGVGKGLRNAYIPDYLPEEAFSGNEIRTWIEDQQTKGILKSGFPALGEYCTRFAETGILGIIVYLIPFFYLLVGLWKQFQLSSCEEKEKIIFYFLSLVGLMASGLGDNLTVTCCYWILIGIGCTLIFNHKDKNERT